MWVAETKHQAKSCTPHVVSRWSYVIFGRCALNGVVYVLGCKSHAVNNKSRVVGDDNQLVSSNWHVVRIT